MTDTGLCDEWHWHCPMCERVYVVSDNLLAAKGEYYARRSLAYYRDQHITEHCDEFANEMDLAGL